MVIVGTAGGIGVEGPTCLEGVPVIAPPIFKLDMLSIERKLNLFFNFKKMDKLLHLPQR